MLFAIALTLLVLFNGLLELLIRAMLLWSALQGRFYGRSHPVTDVRAPPTTAMVRSDAPPFISAHIAIHNEPPELVIATLEAVARSHYAHYEVIVVDNNTADPAVWQPVEAATRRLGPRFRFVHFATLAGAKAGALNEALAIRDPRTSHVAIIDADYQISPQFFATAVATLIAGEVDYVQFPQAYRGVGPWGKGVEQELGDYFACFKSGANRRGAMLPTGTLSLFTADALLAVGGWSGQTITEDAEIGVRLQSAGRRGLWIADHGGHGLLPVDYRGLAKQRARWAAGNMQVLRQVFTRHDARLDLSDRLTLVAQLTAWISFWAIPAMALALVALAPTMRLAELIGGLAAATILASSVLTALRMALLVDRQPSRARVQLASLTAKLALTWTSAIAWMPALLPFRLRFHRTPKVVDQQRGEVMIGLLALSLGFGALALHFAGSAQPLQALACTLLAAVWTSSRIVDASLRRSAMSHATAQLSCS